MKEILTPSAEIILEPKAVNETEEAETHVVSIAPTEPQPTQHIRLITRSMDAGDDSIKLNIYSEFNEDTGETFKVTGDDNAYPISDPDIEVGGTCEFNAFTLWIEDMICSCQSIGGMHELVDVFLMHSCMRIVGSGRE